MKSVLITIILSCIFLTGCKMVDEEGQECKDKGGVYNYQIHQCFSKNAVIEVGKE